MGAGHSHTLYVHEHSLVHGLPSQAKLVGLLLMVASVALTPREAVWAFALYAIAVVLLVVFSRVPLGFVFVRLFAIAPFVVFALFIPFVAGGETVEIAGVSLSVDGLWGAWNILAKATIGASLSILLTATTEIPDIIRGFSVLRVPSLFTSIATFMIRYLELVVDEVRRMRTAMAARGYDPRWISEAKPIAAGAGALFVRSYERGERIHGAMLARGFTGDMPSLTSPEATARDWIAVGCVAIGFVSILVIALVLA